MVGGREAGTSMWCVQGAVLPLLPLAASCALRRVAAAAGATPLELLLGGSPPMAKSCRVTSSPSRGSPPVSGTARCRGGQESVMLVKSTASMPGGARKAPGAVRGAVRMGLEAPESVLVAPSPVTLARRKA